MQYMPLCYPTRKTSKVTITYSCSYDTIDHSINEIVLSLTVHYYIDTQEYATEQPLLPKMKAA